MRSCLLWRALNRCSLVTSFAIGNRLFRIFNHLLGFCASISRLFLDVALLSAVMSVKE